MECQRRYKTVVERHKQEKQKRQKQQKGGTLLKTYLISLMSLAVSVAMLLGTTAAWFTDEVGSSRNEIHAGNLEVDFLYSVGTLANSSWISLKEGTGANEPILSSDTKWYPGLLKTFSLAVEQKGNLSFTYQIGAQLLDGSGNKITLAEGGSGTGTGAEAGSSGAEVASYGLAAWFDVYVNTGTAETEEEVILTKIKADELTAEDSSEGSSWKKVGTLKEVLNGTQIHSGSMEGTDADSEDTGSDGTNAAAMQCIQVAIYMKPDTPNEYIDQRLSNIYIYLLASQSEGVGDTAGTENEADPVQMLAAEEPADPDQTPETEKSTDPEQGAEAGGQTDPMQTPETEAAETAAGDLTAGDPATDGQGIMISESAALNLSGKTWTCGPDEAAITASGRDTVLTLEGDGTVDGGSGGNNMAVCAENGATVKIMDGTYTVGGDADGAGNSVIYARDGRIEIYGGTYYTDAAWNGVYYVLHCNPENDSAIVVYGGAFKNFDPSKGDAAGGTTGFVAEGYRVVESEADEAGDIWYTVVPDGEVNQ